VEVGSVGSIAVAPAERLTWTGPLVLTVGRSVLILGAQAIVPLILMIQGDHSPSLSAGRWWTVDGTVADIGCLAPMWMFSRAEGTTLGSPIGPIRGRHGQDLWKGLGLFILLFPLFIFGGTLSNVPMFGSFSLAPHATGGEHPPFPLWGMIYSLFVWRIVWTQTEQMT